MDTATELLREAKEWLIMWADPTEDDCDKVLALCDRIDAHLSSSESNESAAPVPHGVCRADDPNEEAEKLDAGSSTPCLTRPDVSAAKPKARGVAPSVSDDRAGTSTLVAAPLTSRTKESAARGTWNPNETPEELVERLKKTKAFLDECNALPAPAVPKATHICPWCETEHIDSDHYHALRSLLAQRDERIRGLEQEMAVKDQLILRYVNRAEAAERGREGK